MTGSAGAALPDPVLIAHAVARRCYYIGGRIAPVSIRDQMLRAYLMVDSLLNARQIVAADGERGLLIIGGGAAGVTAATHAVESGIHTVLIEQQPLLFSRQEHCNSRWADPVLYDWPAAHWIFDTFPWPGTSGMPLTLAAGPAFAVTRAWRRQVSPYITTYRDLLDIVHGVRVSQILQEDSFVRASIDFQDNNVVSSVHRRFGAVILASGPGTENVNVGSYRGFAFWDQDPYIKPGLALPPSVRAKVLISGGGDGALQDLLRVAVGAESTREFFREILARVNSSKGSFTWTDLTMMVQDAEDQAHRAFIWGGAYEDYDRSVYRRLDALYTRALEKWWLSNPSAWASVKALLHDKVRREVEHISFVYGHNFLPRCYPLNRLMGHLLQFYFASEDASRVDFMPETRVAMIKPQGHACGVPENCHGQEHEVTLSGKHNLVAHYNVLILRHGIRLNPPLTDTDDLRLPRQVLPYHRP